MDTNFQIPKSVIFAVAAAVGCFVAAILAEVLFISSPLKKVTVIIAVDCSGSMSGNPMMESRAAAKAFVENVDLTNFSVGIMAFADRTTMLLNPSHHENEIKKAIDSLDCNTAGVGYENETQPFTETKEIFKSKEYSNRSKYLIVLADGVWERQDYAIEQAKECRDTNIGVVALGFGGADREFLKRVASSEEYAMFTDVNKIVEAFSIMAQKLTQSVLSNRNNQTSTDTKFSMFVFFQVITWSAMLCFGMAVLIVIIQNQFMRKTLIDQQQLVIFVIGSGLAGLIAGFGGEAAYQILRIGFLGRIIAWALLGAVLALGMSFYIPNLDRKWALLGGGIGGVLGSIGFLVFSLLGDTSGRLIGAAILGACIGAMIGLVETIYRNVWLMVVYDPRNFIPVNLGAQNVTVGSGKSDTVFIDGTAAKAGTFRTEGDKIRYTDSNGTQLLVPGNRVKIGTVELVICSKDVPFSPSKFYPMKMSRVKEYYM
jgi:Ca-activated chloride channel family protein